MVLITQKLRMKKIVKNVSFVILLMKMILVLGQEFETKKRILVDPGHGGNDSGAIGVNGVQEKVITLQLAKQLLTYNKEILNGKFDIYLTRYSDTLISLGDRTKMAKALKPDIFISLHCNDSENPGALGVEAFVSNPIYEHPPLAMRASIMLAYSLTENLEQIGSNNRGVKFANFQVLRETVDYCPSVLIEIAFLSNWDEAELMKAVNRKREYALTILNSIIKYQGE